LSREKSRASDWRRMVSDGIAGVGVNAHLDAWCGGACDAARAELNGAVGVLALGYDGDPTLD